MDEFLKVLADAHISTHEEIENKYEEIYKPFLDRLKTIISADLYDELENEFTRCSCLSKVYYCTEGIKLATEILEKRYVPIF